jgi:ATP/maltotriose-dependent transcriptional regulator MalT
VARTTPRVENDTLASPDGEGTTIRVGEPAWYAWLEQATTFAFASSMGSFTARKERGGRAGRYWKAYRTRASQLRRAYLGKSEDLTLDRLLESAEAGGRMGSARRIRIWMALAFHALGELRAARLAIEPALALAAPEGYVRSFVDEGAPMLELLLEARGRDNVPAYVEKLLAAFADFRFQIADCRLEPKQSAIYNLQSAMVELLTERELKVLRLIADGASNRAIAEQLVITVGTVKRHITNLFGKLGVRSRTQAISAARAIGLLEY